MRLKCGVSVIIAGLCLGASQGCVESTTEALCPAEAPDCGDTDGGAEADQPTDVCAPQDDCPSDTPCTAHCLDGQPVRCDEDGQERIAPPCEAGDICDEGRCVSTGNQDTHGDASDTSEDTDAQGPAPLDATDDVVVDTMDGTGGTLNAQLEVKDATLTQDSNLDGALSPGESAELHLTARNVGTSPTGGISMSLVASDPFVEVTSCDAQLGSEWAPCDTQCDCQGLPEEALVTLDANESTDTVLLRIRFTLADSAPITPITWQVALHDDQGDVWEESVVTEVVASGPSLSIKSVELHDDSDQDGVLTPGEGASIHLFATNDGTEDATDVWAQLLTLDPGVSLVGCYAETMSGWAECSEDCACASIDASALQDLSAGQVSDTAILRVDFELAPNLPLSAVTFGVALTDTHGVTWTDAVSLDVQAL